MKILLVDDTDSTRRGLLRLLEDNGHEVVTASNKNQGLGFLRTWRPELILVAIWMGTIAISIEFISKSKILHPEARLWMLWSDADWEITHLAKGSGAEKVISKSDLIQALKDESIIK
jgi:CheY-like chemotaxis protein